MSKLWFQSRYFNVSIWFSTNLKTQGVKRENSSEKGAVGVAADISINNKEAAAAAGVA